MKIRVEVDYIHTYLLEDVPPDCQYRRSNVEVDEQVLSRWKSVIDAYSTVQNEIGEYLKEKGIVV